MASEEEPGCETDMDPACPIRGCARTDSRGAGVNDRAGDPDPFLPFTQTHRPFLFGVADRVGDVPSPLREDLPRVNDNCLSAVCGRTYGSNANCHGSS